MHDGRRGPDDTGDMSHSLDDQGHLHKLNWTQERCIMK